MTLDPDYIDEADLQACHVYAVKRATDSRRSSQIQLSAALAVHLLLEGHKIVAAYGPKMRKRYREIWS